MEKKPEMVRRSKLVKFVRAKSEVYEMMTKTKTDPQFMEGFAFMIEKLCEEFNITPDELQS